MKYFCGFGGDHNMGTTTGLEFLAWISMLQVNNSMPFLPILFLII